MPSFDRSANYQTFTFFAREVLGPVHTYPKIFVPANFFMRIHLASKRVRRIHSVYPEISVYALQSGNFCIRCVSGYVWTLVSVYFCIRWRHSIRTSLNAHALLTNPLRCPDTNRIRVDGRIRFVYATCGCRYFCIRIKKFSDTKISGCVWTGPQWTEFNTINRRDTTHFDPEDDYRTGCRNVSHCQQQQSFPELRPPGRSHSIYFL